MTRVLFLDHTAQLGGAELSLLDLARHTAGCRVVLLADGPLRQRLATAGVGVQLLTAPASVTQVRRGSRWEAMAALPGVLHLAFRVAAIAHSFDVIHCNSQKAFVVGALAGSIARRPVIWHLRDMLTHSPFSALNRRLVVTLANRLAARVLVNSHATAEAFAAVGGSRDKTAVLYNGINPQVVADEEVRVLQHKLGLTGRQPVLGSFSRLSPWKGQHVLIEAVAALRQRFAAVTALLVGAPLFGEGAYEQKLRQQVTDLGLQEHVRFLGFRNDIPALMALCDVVVHTSVEPEPFGRVIIEGNLACKPVIATGAGGAVELIRNGETGLLVPPGNGPALAAAVERLLADPAFAQRIARTGSAYAREHFSVQRMISEFQRLVTDVIPPRRHTAVVGDPIDRVESGLADGHLRRPRGE